MTWAKQEAGRPSVCCVSLWPYDRFQRCGNLSVKFIGWNRDTPHHEYVWVGKLLLPTQGYIPHRVLDPYVQIFDINPSREGHRTHSSQNRSSWLHFPTDSLLSA